MPIAFLCENAVEAIEIFCISMILSLNGFYSNIPKKRNRHSHFKCIKKHKIKPKSKCYYAVLYLFYLDY